MIRNNFGISITVVIILIVILGVIAFGGCGTMVEPGYVGIKVNKMGSQKGVQDFPIETGWVWKNPLTETVYKFPTYYQSVVWTADKKEGSINDDSMTFNSVEGAQFNVDVAVRYKIKSDSVPQIFVEFRKTAKQITDVDVRSEVRNSFSRAASKMKIMDILGRGKQNLLDEVKTHLNSRMGKKGFEFDMVSFIGKPRVDKRVEDAVNAVIQAKQQAIEAENRVRKSEAEAKQVVATAKGNAEARLMKAKAEAKANEFLQKSINGEVIELEKLKVQRAAIEKWDGKMPTVSGRVTPFINIGQKLGE